jgi:hypothetical protein
VLALGDPRNRKPSRGLVTKRPIYGRNVSNPLNAGQHVAAKRTCGLRALRNCGRKTRRRRGSAAGYARRPHTAARSNVCPFAFLIYVIALSRSREREPPATDGTGAAEPLQTKRTGVGVTIRPRRRCECVGARRRSGGARHVARRLQNDRPTWKGRIIAALWYGPGSHNRAATG